MEKTDHLLAGSPEHPELVEGCGFAGPASFDKLRMLVIISAVSSYHL